MCRFHFGYLAIDLDLFRYSDSKFRSNIVLAIEKRTSSFPLIATSCSTSYGTWCSVTLNMKFDLSIQVFLIFFLGQALWNWRSCVPMLEDSRLLQAQNLSAFQLDQLSLVLFDLPAQPQAAMSDFQPIAPFGRLSRKYGWSSHQIVKGIRQHLEWIGLAQKPLILSRTKTAKCISDQGCRSTAQIRRSTKGLKAFD